MNFKNPFLFVLLSFFSMSNLTAQKINSKQVCNSLNVELLKVDNIEFIVYNKTKNPKPVIIFVRGNGAIPLVIDNLLAGAFPFQVDSLSKDFSYVVVSKPGIPAVVDSLHYKNINIKKGMVRFINNDNTKPIEYVQNNNKDSLTVRINKVVNYLSQQKWVEKKKIFAVGHSAGAHVVANVALANPKVAKIVSMSSNPYGRFQEKIRGIRYKENYDIVTQKEANILIDKVYQEYQDLYDNRFNNKKLYDSDTYFSWASFTFPKLKDVLLSIEQPILYVYGSGDNNRLDTDYLKLDFISNNKHNLSIKKYDGLNHNFMRNNYNEEGKMIGQEFYWNKVINDIGIWLLNNK